MHARNEEYLHASKVTRPRIWTGLLLNESYRVGPLIEQGAATELYDGTEDSTGEPVALKILLPQLAADARTRALFLDEARALRRLSQPGLLRYRACARDPQSDLTYIVTDLVGMRLSSRLASRKLGEQDIVDLTRRLALALAAAHGAGVIHHGLRPHAIALPQGRLSDATITDFNLIKAAHSGLGGAFVDPDYGAPEQLSNSGESAVVGPWTDVYSLALVILSALGKPSEGPRKTSPDLSPLPARLRPVFERMLEPKAARRLQSMDEVVKQLDIALGSAPLQALLNRAQTIRLPSFRFTAARETATPAPRPIVPAMPARTSLPPLPDSLQPKAVPLGKFHGPRAAMGLGGMARRGAAALSALLLAATPWIVQTSFPRGPADASTVPHSAQVQTASKARPPAALPKGQVYGADNTNSRVSLRVHRPTRVVVHSRGNRLLFSRTLQPGDLYRTPTLPDLRVSAEDAGAVEVVLNGVSAGFVGPNGAAVQQARLSQFASLAPARAAPPQRPTATAKAPARNETQAIVGEVEVTPPQTMASAPPVEPPAAEPEVVATEVLPEPPAAVAVSPAAPAPQLQAVIEPEPAPAEPEARRPLLQRLLPWRANRQAAPAVEGTGATAVILAPAITKEAADRAQKAADIARAARLEAQRKAVEANRGRREGAFFNSTLGLNSPY